jgi:hypothetical protein
MVEEVARDDDVVRAAPLDLERVARDRARLVPSSPEIDNARLKASRSSTTP